MNAPKIKKKYRIVKLQIGGRNAIWRHVEKETKNEKFEYEIMKHIETVDAI